MISPNVTIAAAGHPVLPKLRRQGWQYNAPVHTGENCRLGAGVIIVPGITIGDNVVIGAGSVVTKISCQRMWKDKKTPQTSGFRKSGVLKGED